MGQRRRYNTIPVPAGHLISLEPIDGNQDYQTARDNFATLQQITPSAELKIDPYHRFVLRTPGQLLSHLGPAYRGQAWHAQTLHSVHNKDELNIYGYYFRDQNCSVVVTPTQGLPPLSTDVSQHYAYVLNWLAGFALCDGIDHRFASVYAEYMLFLGYCRRTTQCTTANEYTTFLAQADYPALITHFERYRTDKANAIAPSRLGSAYLVKYIKSNSFEYRLSRLWAQKTSRGPQHHNGHR